MPYNENTAKTQFKKGDVPHNTQPVGSEVVRTDGYVQVKIAEPNEWRLKHRLVWEEVHGEIPEGRCLLFLDQDPTNCHIENLRLVTRAELVRLNQSGLLTGEPELNESAVLIAKVLTKTGVAKKEIEK